MLRAAAKACPTGASRACFASAAARYTSVSFCCISSKVIPSETGCPTFFICPSFIQNRRAASCTNHFTQSIHCMPEFHRMRDHVFVISSMNCIVLFMPKGRYSWPKSGCLSANSGVSSLRLWPGHGMGTCHYHQSAYGYCIQNSEILGILCGWRG